jgi:hypothetical protein
MKNKSKDAKITGQLACAIGSERVEEENLAQTPHAKSLKEVASEEGKKEASKPIYLIRYE